MEFLQKHKTAVHLGTEIVVLGLMYYQLSKQNVSLMNRVGILEEELLRLKQLLNNNSLTSFTAQQPVVQFAAPSSTSQEAFTPAPTHAPPAPTHAPPAPTHAPPAPQAIQTQAFLTQTKYTLATIEEETNDDLDREIQQELQEAYKSNTAVDN